MYDFFLQLQNDEDPQMSILDPEILGHLVDKVFINEKRLRQVYQHPSDFSSMVITSYSIQNIQKTFQNFWIFQKIRTNKDCPISQNTNKNTRKEV